MNAPAFPSKRYAGTVWTSGIPINFLLAKLTVEVVKPKFNNEPVSGLILVSGLKLGYFSYKQTLG